MKWQQWNQCLLFRPTVRMLLQTIKWSHPQDTAGWVLRAAYGSVATTPESVLLGFSVVLSMPLSQSQWPVLGGDSGRPSLVSPRILWRWDPTVCSSLCLASFPGHVLQTHSVVPSLLSSAQSCGQTILFLHSSADGHLGCSTFWLWAME